MTSARQTIRVDKWLWHARFFKTRGLATKTVASGGVRVNAERAMKASCHVGPGDTLTFPQARRIRVVRISAIGSRRGPAPEARMLYEDLDPQDPDEVPAMQRRGGGERPAGKNRRRMEKLRWLDLE